MLIPKAVSAAMLQTLYLQNEPAMEIRTGPLRTNRQRAAAKLDVTKLDFKNRAVLLAPPMVFQVWVGGGGGGGGWGEGICVCGLLRDSIGTGGEGFVMEVSGAVSIEKEIMMACRPAASRRTSANSTPAGPSLRSNTRARCVRAVRHPSTALGSTRGVRESDGVSCGCVFREVERECPPPPA